MVGSVSDAASANGQRPLYTPEERVRRDTSKWTLVQGLLAPVQFLIFGVSLYLVIDYLNTGRNYEWAVWSVVVKTLALYTIMITGAIWEKVVFGQYLFHESFFWEDVFSMLVIVLHSLYLFGLFTGIADEGVLFATALAQDAIDAHRGRIAAGGGAGAHAAACSIGASADSAANLAGCELSRAWRNFHTNCAALIT